MWLDNVIKWFLPRETHFFDLLERGADCVSRAGNLLVQCCAETVSYEARAAFIEQLRLVETEADKIIVEVYEALNKTFVTPLDRSDIYTLSTDLEDITDDIFGIVLQIEIHAIDELPQGALELANLVQSACEEIKKAVSLLRHMKQYQEIRQHCKAINKVESEGGQLYRQRMASLFKNEKDPIKLIKQKEFLEGLDLSLNACDDMANALETIVIKNA